MPPKKKKKTGSKIAGKYVGLLNAVSKQDKAKARSIQQSKGFSAAVKFLLSKRKSAEEN